MRLLFFVLGLVIRSRPLERWKVLLIVTVCFSKSKSTGVKKIRIHDIRHSAVSLLINMGFSVLAIGERMGHEAEKITYRYAHLFPTVQTEMAEKLEMERMTKED